MTLGVDDAITPPAAPEEKNNPIERLAGAFIAPVSTFEAIARRPNILVPLLLFIVIGYVSTYFMMPRMDWAKITEQQADAIKAKNPNVSDADLQRMSKFTIAIGKVGGWVAPALSVVWYVFVAGVLLLAFRMMGGEGTFKQALSATLHAWLPLVVFSIIAVIVAVARGGLIDPTQMQVLVKSNPAFLVSMKEHPVLFSFLTNFDVFTLWMLALLTIGFAALSRFSKAKSAAIIFFLWAIFIFVKLGFAALGASRMKA
ncbi:MAG TPA: Yip1 family protein [Thermoanaerobaculia bacterium]|nr:Yip1 family protein [Thermoanaerobaculia bacterium]